MKQLPACFSSAESRFSRILISATGEEYWKEIWFTLYSSLSVYKEGNFMSITMKEFKIAKNYEKLMKSIPTAEEWNRRHLLKLYDKKGNFIKEANLTVEETV